MLGGVLRLGAVPQGPQAAAPSARPAAGGAAVGARGRAWPVPAGAQLLPAQGAAPSPVGARSGTTTFPRGSFGVPDPASPGGGSGAAGCPWAPLPVPPRVTRSLHCPAQPAPPPTPAQTDPMLCIWDGQGGLGKVKAPRSQWQKLNWNEVQEMGAAFTAKQWSDVPEAGGAARCWELLSPVLWPQPCPELPGFPAGLWLGSPADGTVGAVLPPAPTQTPWQGLCWRLPPLFRAPLDSPPRAPQQAGARGCLRPHSWGPRGFPHTDRAPWGVRGSGPAVAGEQAASAAARLPKGWARGFCSRTLWDTDRGREGVPREGGQAGRGCPSWEAAPRGHLQPGWWLGESIMCGRMGAAER